MIEAFDRCRVIAGSTVLAASALVPTVPAIARAPSVDFLVICDWGRDGTTHQRKVAAAMRRSAEQTNARLVVTTGDNFYDLPLALWFDIYPRVRARAVPGKDRFDLADHFLGVAVR